MPADGADIAAFFDEVMAVGVFALILFAASVSDVKTRIVKDEYTVMLLITAVLTNPLLKCIGGAFLTVLPFMAVLIFSKKSMMGGADVKIAFGIGAVLGAEKGLIAVMLGLVAAVTVEGVKGLVKKERSDGFPLVPYMAAFAVILRVL